MKLNIDMSSLFLTNIVNGSLAMQMQEGYLIYIKSDDAELIYVCMRILP